MDKDSRTIGDGKSLSLPRGGDAGGDRQRGGQYPMPTSVNVPAQYALHSVAQWNPSTTYVFGRSAGASDERNGTAVGIVSGHHQQLQQRQQSQRQGRQNHEQWPEHRRLEGSGDRDDEKLRQLRALEIELHYRELFAKQREEAASLSSGNSRTSGPRAPGDVDIDVGVDGEGDIDVGVDVGGGVFGGLGDGLGGRRGGGGGGDDATRAGSAWHSAGLEPQGRVARMKRGGTSTGNMPVLDSMAWTQGKTAVSWPSPPLAPLRRGGDGPTPPDSKKKKKKRVCRDADCQRIPSYAHPGEKAACCAKHKLAGMVNVVSKKCAAPGCLKGPSYGDPGSKPVFCAGHRLSGQINVVSPRCDVNGCRKGPSFGLPGASQKATYCVRHKLSGMVNVTSRRCRAAGCEAAPSFALEGEKASFCGKHKKDGQVNVISRRCMANDCTKVRTASSIVAGKKTPRRSCGK